MNSVDLLVKSLDLALEVGTNFCTCQPPEEACPVTAPRRLSCSAAPWYRMQLLDGTFILRRFLGNTRGSSQPGNRRHSDFAGHAGKRVNKLIDANADRRGYLSDAGFVRADLRPRQRNRNLDGRPSAPLSAPATRPM
jgi:hypothetical protein